MKAKTGGTSLSAIPRKIPSPGWERARVRVDADAWHRLKQLILAKTQGTPFFMEEVVQTLVEDGTLSKIFRGAEQRSNLVPAEK